MDFSTSLPYACAIGTASDRVSTWAWTFGVDGKRVAAVASGIYVCSHVMYVCMHHLI